MWGDCDAAGIVFYPNYYRWMDEASFLLFSSVGLGWNELRARYGTPGAPLVSSHADYRAPSKFADRLTVESRVAEWGRSSFTVAHRFTRGDVLVAEGWEKRVWVTVGADDPARIAPAPIPDEVRAAFAVD
jgi:YbgC/YbaW family acyl-CoA thioester hydrolase